MIEILAQVTGVHRRQPFYAGLVLWDDEDGCGAYVVEAAPILRRYFPKGVVREHVLDYCNERGWKIAVVHKLTRSRAGLGPAPGGRRGSTPGV